MATSQGKQFGGSGAQGSVQGDGPRFVHEQKDGDTGDGNVSLAPGGAGRGRCSVRVGLCDQECQAPGGAEQAYCRARAHENRRQGSDR